MCQNVGRIWPKGNAPQISFQNQFDNFNRGKHSSRIVFCEGFAFVGGGQDVAECGKDVTKGGRKRQESGQIWSPQKSLTELYTGLYCRRGLETPRATVLADGAGGFRWF